MADGKWIEQLKATTSVTQAAHHALLPRLQAVRNYLPKALHEADHDPEYVHQLRVATRRADAVLRIFSLRLPDKVCRIARRRLKHIRRAAGAARDLDVFTLSLLEQKPSHPEREQPGLDFLVGHTLAQRSAAQKALHETCKRDGLDFDEFMRDVILAVRQPADSDGDATLLVLARPLLSNLLHDLETRAAGDLTEYVHLHEVRIAGKRLRYAMEVFASCFGPVFRDTLYPRIEEMQEILGRANDSHVAGERLKQIRAHAHAAWPAAWKRLGPGVDALLKFHHRRLPVERRRFLRWWKQWQKDGAEMMMRCLSEPGAV